MKKKDQLDSDGHSKSKMRKLKKKRDRMLKVSKIDDDCESGLDDDFVELTPRPDPIIVR